MQNTAAKDAPNSGESVVVVAAKLVLFASSSDCGSICCGIRFSSNDQFSLIKTTK